MDGIPLPKTYTTRKGALQLYVGPEDLEDEDTEAEDSEKKDDSYALKPKYVEIKRPHGQELINLSLRLGTMERLAMSVLQFGDNVSIKMVYLLCTFIFCFKSTSQL